MNNKLIVITAIASIASWVSADMLIGWDKDRGINYSYAATGVGGTLFTANSGGIKTDGNSTDGTYGSAFTGADTSVNWVVGLGKDSIVGGTTNNIIGIKIDNNTGYDLVLDKLHFDASRIFAGAVQDITVRYGYGNLSGVANAEFITSVHLETQSKIADYTNFDISLTGLADYTLETGQSATFQLVGTYATANTLAYIDNIAISGSVIPEPATLGLVGFVAAGLLFVRRLTA